MTPLLPIRRAVFDWACLIPLLICAVMAVPYLRGPRNLGYGDWDLNLEKYEAVRRTVLEWGQFPWWDPWCRGGFPLAANPQCGVLGIATPLVLALGTSVGMRFAQLACLLIAMEGARRLAWLWFREPLAAVAAGLIYGINGAVLSQAVYGYHLPMSYCSFPWLLYYAFRLDRRRSDGALLGFWLAFNVLNGINYYSVYAADDPRPSSGSARSRARSGPARSRFLVHTVLAVRRVPRAGRMAARNHRRWSFATFPRPYQSGHDFTPWSILMYLLSRPRADVLASMENPEFWETLWYVGPVVLALAAVEPGARLAVVAHPDRRLHLARGRLGRLVPPELLAGPLPAFHRDAHGAPAGGSWRCSASHSRRPTCWPAGGGAARRRCDDSPSSPSW